jgi:hypothetical protein
MTDEEVGLLLESRVSRRKKHDLICGVGHYDVTFPQNMTVNGKKKPHPAFRIWRGILRRCCCPVNAKEAHTYEGCKVSSEWLYFSSFLTFYKKHYRPDYALDKDILCQGNRVYSADTCVFIPQALNNFISDRKACRGLYPQGVSFDKERHMYQANISLDGKGVKLGRFNSPKEAHLCWFEEKLKQAHLWKSVCDDIHPSLHSSLIQKVQLMLEYGEDNGK